MNPIAIGTPSWDFLSKFPRAFRDEILSSEQILFSINFIYFTIKIFMCKICSTDGMALLKKANFLKKIGFYFNDTFIVTRYSLQKFMYDFHNIVHKKLGKPIHPVQFEATLREDVTEEWKKSFLQFLTYLCFYYPSDSDPEWEKKKDGEYYNNHYYIWNKTTTKFYIRFYFQQIVSKAFNYFGICEKLNIFDAKLYWQERNNLIRAFLEEKKLYLKQNQSECWEYKDLKIFIEAIRAKSKICGTNKMGSGSIFQGCQ